MSATSGESDKHAFFRELEEDHAELKRLLASIGETVQARAVPAADVLQLLSELADRLQSHFFLEEDGGYFAEALDHSPHLESQCQGLMAQHPVMTDRCHQIVIEAQGVLETEEFWDVVHTQFSAFHETLLRHEQGEDELIQAAYTLDIGDKD